MQCGTSVRGSWHLMEPDMHYATIIANTTYSELTRIIAHTVRDGGILFPRLFM